MQLKKQGPKSIENYQRYFASVDAFNQKLISERRTKILKLIANGFRQDSNMDSLSSDNKNSEQHIQEK